jgi:hypothetical protein
MIEDVTKEVYFHEYCPTCKHKKKRAAEDPCNECLTYPSNINSHKPVNWEAKKK